MNQRYKKEENLKVDCNTSVDLVRDELTGKRYVSKMVLKQANPLAIHQFHVEVDLLSMLHCPFVPELIDVYETASYFVLIETWIDGIPLNEYKKKHSLQWFKLRKNILLRSYFLLEQVHALNYVYVDLKPQNLLLKEKQLYLIDFNSCIEKDCQRIVSASTFNFKDKANQREFGLDAQAFYSLIRYLYPKNLFYLLLKHASFKKMKRQFLCILHVQRCFVLFLVISLSLCLIKQMESIENDPLEKYLKNRKKEDFTIAYQSTNQENDTDHLYMWIDNAWLDDALFEDFTISKKLIKDANKTHDEKICSYILKRIPKKNRENLKEYEFVTYQILGEIPSQEWIESYVSYLLDKNLFKYEDDLISFLLNEQIPLSKEAFEKMGELMSKNMDKMNASIACRYLEYALFLKTKNVSDLSLPISLIESYQDQEEWKSLFMIWEEVK